MKNLDQLAIKHGTDKSSRSHGYTRLYQRYLTNLPTRGSLLELGWGGHEDPDVGGASARMWREWLPSWHIAVIDNEEKNLTERDLGIYLHHGSQADPKTIDLAADLSGPFDIIVDDASHLSSLTIESFKLLWPHLAPGGWYVVEDTHMSYHDFYYGEEEANRNPGSSANGNQTAMQFLKRLADEANYRGRAEFDLFPEDFWLGYEVEEVHFHFNIVFVKKRLD